MKSLCSIFVSFRSLFWFYGRGRNLRIKAWKGMFKTNHSEMLTMKTWTRLMKLWKSCLWTVLLEYRWHRAYNLMKKLKNAAYAKAHSYHHHLQFLDCKTQLERQCTLGSRCTQTAAVKSWVLYFYFHITKLRTWVQHSFCVNASVSWIFRCAKP